VLIGARGDANLELFWRGKLSPRKNGHWLEARAQNVSHKLTHLLQMIPPILRLSRSDGVSEWFSAIRSARARYEYM
jgi:hypothetical protein